MSSANRLTLSLRECARIEKEFPFPNRASKAGLTYQDLERLKQCATDGAGTFALTMALDWDEAVNPPLFPEYARWWVVNCMDTYRGGIVTEAGKDVMREMWLKPSNAFDAAPIPSMQNIHGGDEIGLSFTDRALLRRLVRAGAGGIGCLMLVKWMAGTNQGSFRQFGPGWLRDWTGFKWGLVAIDRAWPDFFSGGIHA